MCTRSTFSPYTQVKKYDSKAALAGTPKAYSTGEDMVDVKVGTSHTPSEVRSTWCDMRRRQNVTFVPVDRELVGTSAEPPCTRRSIFVVFLRFSGCARHFPSRRSAAWRVVSSRLGPSCHAVAVVDTACRVLWRITDTIECFVLAANLRGCPAVILR